MSETEKESGVSDIRELLEQALDALEKGIEFIPAGYGIERLQWETIDRLKDAIVEPDEIEILHQRVKELVNAQAGFMHLSDMRQAMFDTGAENDALRAELAALKQESNGYRFSAENNYKLYIDLLEELNKLKAGQGEPVAERIAQGTAVDWWWKKTDCPIGTLLYTAPTIPEGYVMVPVEPLHKLLEYAEESNSARYGTLSTRLVRDLVEEALAAAPKPEER